ncbi:MAG TPA: DUF378 domain-containing protein [Candidatus Limnocylindrales bacterium]|nr:DUF378 domain-containing protein [Candidatus Limnocylindrales bacterium]
MRYINALALLLVIVGAVNWLLVGIAKFDLVAQLTGATFGETNAISSLVYIVVGLAGIALLPTLARWVMGDDGERVEAGSRA